MDQEQLLIYLGVPRTAREVAEKFGVSPQAVYKRMLTLVRLHLVARNRDKRFAERITFTSRVSGRTPSKQTSPRRSLLSVMRPGQVYTAADIGAGAQISEMSAHHLLHLLITSGFVWTFTASGRRFYVLTELGDTSRQPDHAAAPASDLAAELGRVRCVILLELTRRPIGTTRDFKRRLSWEAHTPIDVLLSKSIRSLERDELLKTDRQRRPYAHRLTQLGLLVASYLGAVSATGERCPNLSCNG